MSFSPDGELFASAHDDGTLKLWNLRGQLLGTFQDIIAPLLVFSLALMAKLFASAGRDKTIKLWTLDGQTLRTLKGHAAEVKD